MKKEKRLRISRGSIVLTLATVLPLCLTSLAHAQDPYVPFFRSISGFFTDQTNDGINNFSAPGTDIAFEDTPTPVNTSKVINDTYDNASASVNTHSDYAGFFAAKNYAQIAINNVQSDGYYAIAGRGSHTTVKFFTPDALAERAVFHWHVTGNSSIPVGVAGSRIDFAAGNYANTDFNGFFDIPTPQRLEQYGPGNYTYTLPMTLNQPIDLFYWSSAYIQVNYGEATSMLGGTLSGFADFSNTYSLDSIDLFDGTNQPITNWTLEETNTPGVALFNQDGRTLAAGVSSPEPNTLALIILGGVGIVARRQKRK